MMQVEPPHEIRPLDETTDKLVQEGKVVVGKLEALERLKRRLKPRRLRLRDR